MSNHNSSIRELVFLSQPPDGGNPISPSLFCHAIFWECIVFLDIPNTMTPSDERLSISLPAEILLKIDCIKSSLGVRSRSAVIEKVLREVFLSDEEVEQ